MLVLMAMYVAAVAFVLWQLHNWKFEHTERQHLAAIPIDPAACPNVEVMHQAALQFSRAYPFFGVTEDASGRLIRWPEARLRLAQAANLLEDSITASLERFPTQVQWYLTAARDNIRRSRVQLDLARDGLDLELRTAQSYGDGKEAFGFAGDLIGNQCAVPLGA